MFIPQYTIKSDDKFVFGSEVSAKANKCLDNKFIKEFWSGFCCQAGEVKITPVDELIFSVGEAEMPTLDGNQYAVSVEKGGFTIVGDSEKGLINGFMTLLHQIKATKITDDSAEFEIPCGVFKEKPTLKNQMVHFCIFPETELWELDRFIRLCGALKYTHIVVEFWGMFKYDCLKELSWSHGYTKEQIRPLFKMANQLGIEIIPMFNHWGHASASRVIHGKHVVLDQNPRLQPLFSDDGWVWNLKNKDTLELLRKIRTELIDLCGEGEYFHLGCDEAYNVEITEENYTVLTSYLNGIAQELKGFGRRAIVWGDMLIAKREKYETNNSYITNCQSEKIEKLILSDLSRDIIIADWQYNVKEEPVETALTFKNAGFDTLLCPWDFTVKCDSITPCVGTAKSAELMGIMHTTWNSHTIGMRDVGKAAYLAWSSCTKDTLPQPAFFGTHTATVVRKVFPVNGDYRKAGWSKTQVGDYTLL
ncbi:MAG: family 20 glycosylhydrolase [Clostridia bacterium]|nr:family 20 glycosylhydrolase [Clostridia bacterium]